MKETTQQKVFFWNIFGSLSSAVVSVILLVVVTRVLSSESADLYSFAYAIANLLVIVASFQVRDFQATDIQEKYSFDAYLVTRILSNILMVLILIGYIIVTPSTHNNMDIIFGVSFFRVSEALSDVFQGLFQQRERLDIAGKSLFIRNSLSTLGFFISLIISRNLLLSVIIQIIIAFFCIGLFDYPQSKAFHKIIFFKVNVKDIFSILKDCFPLLSTPFYWFLFIISLNML